MAKVTAKKYEGDDCYSYAVFIDGRVTQFTGLSRDQAAHYKDMVRRLIKEGKM